MRVARIPLALFIAAACGGESTSPQRPHVASLAVVGGDAQTDTVLALLPRPVEVLVAGIGGVPIAGQLVNFKTSEGCGAPFAGSAITNAQGRALERWTLGERAGACYMEARAVDQVTGAAVVYDTAVAQVTPSVATSFATSSAALPLPQLGPAGLTFPVGKHFAFIYTYHDRFGNLTSRMPDGGAGDRLSIVFDSAVVRVDSVVSPAIAGVRHSVGAGAGWIYMTARAAGTTPFRATARLSASMVIAGSQVSVSVTPN